MSAVIRPSRRLRQLHALLCLLVLAAACLCRQPALQGVMAAAALAGACLRPRAVNGVRLDISGVGGIRVAVYRIHAPVTVATRDGADTDVAAAGQAMRLMPGSTLWPALLLLRLQGADGAVHWLAVLPDTVAPEVLRRVSLALRAIAAQGPPPA